MYNMCKKVTVSLKSLKDIVDHQLVSLMVMLC